MITLTKEWLKKTIAELEEERDATPGAVNEDAANALAAMKLALASLEAEPVAEVCDGFTLRYVGYGHAPKSGVRVGDRLYTAPPAPVAMKDHQIRDLVNELRDIAVEYYGTQQLRERIAKTVRAAMLQGADGALTNEDTMPTMLFKPVADLYGLTSPTGSETSFTFDAVEARDFIDGGWSCQEYVELERFQKALLQGAEHVSNRDELTDGWVVCSERMPDIGTEIFYFCQDDGLRDCGIVSSSNFSGKGHAELYVHAEGYDLRFGVDITHWMPLPAAPQQEVK